MNALEPDQISLNFEEILMALKTREYIDNREVFQNAKEIFGAKSHGYLSVDENTFMHTINTRSCRGYMLRNIRKDIICIQILLSGSYARSAAGHVEIVNSSATHITNFPISIVDVKKDYLLQGIYIATDRKYLVQRYGVHVDRIPDSLRPIFDSPAGMPQALSFPTCASVYENVYRIINSKFGGPLKIIYARAKAIEIICDTVYQLHGLAAVRNGTRIPKIYRTSQLIEAASLIYQREIHTPPSIEQLTARLGINRNELNKGFREMFGTTPHAYGLSVRMQKANDLLEVKGITISEIARRVGYEGYASFTRAYMEYFGYSPLKKR